MVMAAEGHAKFRAPWGRALSVISIGATAFLLIVPSAVAFNSAATPNMRSITIAAPILLLVGCAAFTVLGYEIRDGALLIRRPGWSTRVSLRGLRGATIKPNAMRSSIRLFGNGGLFGFTGLFWNRALGRYRAYVTDLKRTVVLTLADRTIVVSPDAPESFVAQINRLGFSA